MTNIHRKKTAFTMLELVMVIVILGILAVLSMSRMDRDIRQEAGDNILSAIRYTQHLALVDDKTDPFDATWQNRLWKISFSTSANNLANFYTVSSRNDNDNQVDKDETAIDPANGKYMYNLGGNTDIGTDESPNIFIGKKYGINNMAFVGGCSAAQHIAFDHLGRPFSAINAATNDYNTYMGADCNLTFDFAGGEDSISIIIEKETGYAYIDGQDDS